MTTALSALLNTSTALIGSIVAMLILNWRLSFTVTLTFPLIAATAYVGGAFVQALNFEVTNVSPASMILSFSLPAPRMRDLESL